MARTSPPKPPKNRKAPKAPKEAPAGKEKFLDRMGRYSLYGQAFGNDSANMTMGQRVGGAAYSALESATLGKMGTLGKAVSAGISSRGAKSETTGGSGIDTQTIPFQQIKGDDVVGAINQSTQQLVSGLNTLNSTFGKGVNGLNDRLQSQGQALNSIVASNEDVAIQMREMLEALNKSSYDRGGSSANESTLGGRGAGADGAGKVGGDSILGNILQHAAVAGGVGLIAKLLGKTRVGKYLLGGLSVLGLGTGVDAAIPDATPQTKPPVTTPKPETQGRAPRGSVDANGKKIGGQFTARPAPPATPGSSWYDDAMKMFKGTGKTISKFASKAATPVLAAIAIWKAWEQISALDSTMPLEKYRSEVAKIVGKAVGEFGLVLVGGIVGAIIAGVVSGPGAIIGLLGGIAGGLLAEYAMGDNVDAIVDSVVNFLYEGKKEQPVKGAVQNNKNTVTPVAQSLTGKDILSGVVTPTLAATPGATLRAPGTSEEKLKQQEAAAEAAQKKTIAENLTINANEMTFKADKIVFDTSSLEFNYDKETMQEKEKASAETDSGASPSSRLPGGVTPGSDAEAAGSTSSVTPGGAPGPMPKLEALDAGKARENAEKYLGRKMSDQEYDYLMRATHAEAGAGQQADPREQAMIMASILNRAREKGDNGVIKALTAENQFQAVTGTKYEPGPSANFTQGPDAKRQESIETSSQMLGSIPQEQKNFTAASSAAYGPGTKISYRDKMIAAGGTQMGGSVFNTNPNFDTAGQTPSTPTAGQEPGAAAAAAGLTFSQGVNKNINEGIAEKVKGIQSAFGGALTISSGYRDPKHNKKVGGAKNSAHMRKNAVDVKFNGGIPETLKLIKVASQMGIGGIGVYRPGSVHLDTENRRAWGPSYGRSSVPSWAEDAIRAHETGQMGAYDPTAAGTAGADATIESGSGGGSPGISPTSDASGMGRGLGSEGGGSNPLASMLGGGGSPFGMASALLGPIIGGMSKNASLTAAAPKAQAPSTNIINNSKAAPSASGGNGPNPGQPQPAISSMFAKLFEGSAMFG